MEYPSLMVEKGNSIAAADTMLLDPFEAELQLIFARETPVRNENENIHSLTNASEQDILQKNDSEIKFEENYLDEEKRILSNLDAPNENEGGAKETTKDETIEGPEKEDKFEHLRMLIKNKTDDRYEVQETEANQNPEKDEKEINTLTSTICLSTATSTKLINADEIEVIPRTCPDGRHKEESSEVTRELENYDYNEDKYLDLFSSSSLISSASEDISEHSAKLSENKIIHAPTSSDSRSITLPPAQIMFEQNSDQQEEFVVSSTSSPTEILFEPNSDQQQEEYEVSSTSPPAEILFEQNSDQQQEASYVSIGMYESGQNPCERLYIQGINNQRRKDIERNRVLQERQKEMKLNLATRSYYNGRVCEKPHLNNVVNNTLKKARSMISSKQPSRQDSVYNRLHNRNKRNEYQGVPSSRRKQVALDSTRVSDSVSKSKSQPSYYLAKQERVREEKMTFEMKELEERKQRELAKRERSAQLMYVSPAHERLYFLAKQKRLSEERRALARKEELLRLEALAPKTLQLATRRSSTPQRKYNDGSNVHTRLYENAQRKMLALEEKQYQKSKRSNGTSSKQTTGSRSSSVNRLYGRSAKKQEEGKKLREEIASRKKKRDPTPTAKISIHRATDIYRRGIMTKVQLELKREDEGPDTSYVSPLLNPLVLEDEDDISYSSPVKSTPIKVNRGRSLTPVRDGKNNRHSQDSQSRVSRISEKLSTGSTNYAIRSRSLTPSRSMTPSRVRSSSRLPSPRNCSRVRSRSRIRPLNREPSPSISRTNIKSSGRKDGSRPQMIPRGRTPHKRDSSVGRRRNSAAERSCSPKVSSRTNSIKTLLRRMESDVTFYNTVKKALSDKEILDKELKFKDESGSFDSAASTLPSTKADSVRSIQTENESDVSLSSSTNSNGTVFLINSN